MSHRGYKKTKQVQEVLHKEAVARQAEYDKLSLQQKLDRLPPEPHAKKQRAKLLNQKRPVNAEGQFVKFGEAEATESVVESKSLKAKERRAQEKK